MSSIKLVITSQTRYVIQYKNLKRKVLKYKANINFNQWWCSTGKITFVFQWLLTLTLSMCFILRHNIYVRD